MSLVDVLYCWSDKQASTQAEITRTSGKACQMLCRPSGLAIMLRKRILLGWTPWSTSTCMAWMAEPPVAGVKRVQPTEHGVEEQHPTVRNVLGQFGVNWH